MSKTLGSKDIGIRKLDFVAKTQFPCFNLKGCRKYKLNLWISNFSKCEFFKFWSYYNPPPMAQFINSLY